MTFDTLRNQEAPEYKYFTVDLMSNEILSEIPFQGVSYERAIKGAGAFSGSIGVNDETDALNLYNSTMPGNTALFVVRNNVCVWGGIIWSRNYDIVARTLKVDASEFTSYFYHRRIWKTWNHEYGATMNVVDGLATLALDLGSTTAFAPGSQVRLEFREPAHFRYNNYYTISKEIAPSTIGFALETTNITTNATTLTRNSSDIVTIETDKAHGLSVGDIVTVDIYLYPDYNGDHRVVSVGDGKISSFSYELQGAVLDKTDVTGTVTRGIPDGTYLNVTVITHTDTYDYIRKLIDGVFNDFSGVNFPNKELEPGLAYNVSIIGKKILDGVATITVDMAHNLVTGQTVLIENLDPVLNGEHIVHTIPTDTTFTFYISAEDKPFEPVSIRTADISQIKATAPTGNAAGETVMYPVTVAAHDFNEGETVTISTQLGYAPQAQFRNGEKTIAALGDGSTTKFSYNDGTPVLDSPVVTFAPATVEVTAGGSLGTDDIIEAFLKDGVATLTTKYENQIAVDDVITVSGVAPFYEITNRSYSSSSRTVEFTHTARDTTTVTITTGTAHGFSKYERVTISGSTQPGVNGTFLITNVPSTTTFTFTSGTNGTYLTTVDDGLVTAMGTATIGISLGDGQAHPLEPGDAIDVSGITEKSNIRRVEIRNKTNTSQTVTTSAQSEKTVTLTTSAKHGFSVDDYVKVAGTTRGSGAFNGTVKITKVPSKYTFTYTISTSASVVSGSETGATAVLVDTATLFAERNHGFFRGDTVTIDGIIDKYNIKERTRASNVATLKFDTIYSHNVRVDDKVTVKGIYDKFTVTQRVLTDGLATITLGADHDIVADDSILVKDVLETYKVLTGKLASNVVTLTLSAEHNIVSGDTIGVLSLPAKFRATDEKTYTVTKVTARTISYEYETDNVSEMAMPAGTTINRRSASVFNGEAIRVYSVNGRQISYKVPDAKNVEIGSYTEPDKVVPQAFVYSTMNGIQTITAIDTSAKTISYSNTGIELGTQTVAKPIDSDNYIVPVVRTESKIQGDYTVMATPSGDTIILDVTSQALKDKQDDVTTGTIYKNASSFNGAKTVYAKTDTTVTYSTDGPRSDVFEEAVNAYAYARPTDIYNKVGAVVTAIDPTLKQFSYARAHGDVPRSTIMGYGQAVVAPVVRIGTYGPYTNNSDIGIKFSTGAYSGVNIRPTVYRGFELVSVGEALDKYSDNINGFEYRVDCAYDPDTLSFTKTFVLIPINFPNPPAPGEVSPLERFGAEKTVFEYPGNISNITINESAEYSSTRFFASGETDLGGEAGYNYSAAADAELLNYDSFGRKWPLLDDDEKVNGVDAKSTLYQYARKYMSESRPPDAEITIKVNGSLEPQVGDYKPGDWCSIIVNDRFVQARLQTDFEVRNEILVRKIESISVSVPDGVTFPESVSLKVVPEWEVDKRG